MIHRDIKPSNVIVTPGGIVKVLDLGLARLLDAAKHDDIPKEPATRLGTPDYAAPEQWINAANVDYRADLYGLGRTLIHLVAGRPPTLAATTDGKLLVDRFPPQSDRLVRILAEMTAVDPTARPNSAARIADELASLAKDHQLADFMNRTLGHAPAEESHRALLGPHRREGNRWRRFGITGLLLLAAGGTAAAIAASGFGNSPFDRTYRFDDGTLQGWVRCEGFRGRLINPGGFLRARHFIPKSPLCIRAPDWHGDLRGYTGLAWDEILYHDQAAPKSATAAYLVGGPSRTVYYHVEPPGPVDVWHPRFASFRDAGVWQRVEKFGATGTDRFEEVLADIEAVYLSLDCTAKSFGNLEAGIDNVRLVEEL